MSFVLQFSFGQTGFRLPTPLHARILDKRTCLHFGTIVDDENIQYFFNKITYRQSIFHHDMSCQIWKDISSTPKRPSGMMNYLSSKNKNLMILLGDQCYKIIRLQSDQQSACHGHIPNVYLSNILEFDWGPVRKKPLYRAPYYEIGENEQTKCSVNRKRKGPGNKTHALGRKDFTGFSPRSKSRVSIERCKNEQVSLIVISISALRMMTRYKEKILIVNNILLITQPCWQM